MKYKINKFPAHLFEKTIFTDVKNEGSNWILTFYKKPIEANNKITISFTGEQNLINNLNKEITSVSINQTLGFSLQNKLLKTSSYEEIDDYQQLNIVSDIGFFQFGSTQFAAKNIVVEEIDSDDIVFRTRKMVMPANLNGAGTLFGGKALEWVDEESAIYASCQMGVRHLVTAYMSAITFESPAYDGDIIEIGSKVVKFGKTSITVKCVIRNKTTKRNICIVDEIVFVALDENGKPTPHGKNKELKD